jgi:hypothetical protein
MTEDEPNKIHNYYHQRTPLLEQNVYWTTKEEVHLHYKLVLFFLLLLLYLFLYFLTNYAFDLFSWMSHIWKLKKVLKDNKKYDKKRKKDIYTKIICKKINSIKK